MLNKYPLWKNIMLVVVAVLSAIYAAPNFYQPDPAIQISHDNGVMDQAALTMATSALDADGIGYFGAEIGGNGVALIRLKDQNQQSRAQQVINYKLPQDYIVALNLAPTTPAWLVKLRAGPMAYGLDLQGGVHFLMEVDMNEATTKQMNDNIAAMRGVLRDEKIRYRPPITLDAQKRINLRFLDAATRSTAITKLREKFSDLKMDTIDSSDDFIVQYSMTPARTLELQKYAIQQNLTTLRQRVNELGVKEPKIQQMGANRIIIELPGIQDTTRAKDLISAVATLQFLLVADPNTPATSTKEYSYKGSPVKVNSEEIAGGGSVTNARSSIDNQTSLPQVNITMDSVGAKKMNDVTRISIGKSMAILLSETKTRSVTRAGADGKLETTSEPFLEERLISVATIQAALGREFRITGLGAAEANDLALLIRSGALAAPMHFVEESTIGPSLGQQNITNGLHSVELGLALLVVFMLGYYRIGGFASTIALFCNLLLLVAIMSIVGWTLTMPGIAGIVLTLGIAVDGNVLIFARIREEIENGMSIPRAIHAGYERAFVTIVDANVTTLIVSVILFSIGTGPVKGFAVTLGLGLLTSMFTSIMYSRAIINLLYGGNNVKKISIGTNIKLGHAALQQ
ncbi:MAG TPA: protein translocase subunit SecD [Candidatus Acidoferrum sp.]|nr:protein translocase subunit SecD [Candidatus Acidoferrum sp.]